MPLVRRENLASQNAQRLFAAADARVLSLYGDADRCGPTPETLASQEARFFVVGLGGEVVGCGGFTVLDDGAGELKRFFVEPGFRGRGVGRALLQAVEDAAAAEGVELLRLETGVWSSEAIHLYERAGYVRRGPYGPYGPDPLSVFMEKRLS